jgi:hypothetical protein
MSGRYEARRPQGLDAEAVAARKKEFETNQALEYFAQASRRQKELDFPIKHHKPKVSRLMSPRQRAAFSMTDNPMRSMFRPADKAATDWKYIKPGDESIMTRNVGPLDRGSNYCHGKETGYTGIRDGRPER